MYASVFVQLGVQVGVFVYLFMRADDMLCVRMMGNLGCIRATVRSDFSGNPAVGVPCATSDVDTT